MGVIEDNERLRTRSDIATLVDRTQRLLPPCDHEAEWFIPEAHLLLARAARIVESQQRQIDELREMVRRKL